MNTKTFASKFLIDELDLPYNAEHEEIIDSSRWSILYRIVFEYEGKFYQTTYSVGATEYQDEMPWEHVDTVTCTEVELREVTVTKWVPVGKS